MLRSGWTSNKLAVRIGSVRLQKMKNASLALLLLGALFTVYCFGKFSAAGLPYQDATSAQLAFQQEELRLWGACIFFGIFASVVGILGLRKNWKTREGQTDAST